METTEQAGLEPEGPRFGPVLVFDVAVGLSSLALATTVAAARGAKRAAVVVLGLPQQARSGGLLQNLAHRGEQQEDELKSRLSTASDEVVQAVVDAILSRIDLNETVRRYVDVNSLVKQVDLQEVITSLDLAGLAEGVIAEVDLSEIIRQSTGSLSSETARGVRMQGISGDDVIDEAVGKIRLRFSRKPAAQAGTPGTTGSSGGPGSSADS
ncbi:hypothetical protein [Kribbella sp. NPDC004875]|uniref:hypothetical protein n=1 Tax=Kribbella sp. NPDC004875 TaxID=3364107 RepID=UPI0036BF8CF0